MKALLYTIGLAVVIAAIIGLALSPTGTASPAPAAVTAQGGLAAPANVRAADGGSPGTATVSWDAVAGAAFYRVGWVAADDVAAVQADGRHWLDAFDFKDVANTGQTSQGLKGLTPSNFFLVIKSLIPVANT